MEENTTMDNQSQPIENEEIKAEETVANQAEETANAESAGSATADAGNTASESGSEEDKMKELEEKCAKLHDEYIHLYADFENYKKQALKARAELIKSAGEGIFVMHSLADNVSYSDGGRTVRLEFVVEGIDPAEALERVSVLRQHFAVVAA